MYSIGDTFTVYSAFSNSKNYIYRVGEELVITGIKGKFYVLTTNDELADPFSKEFKEVIMDEEGINMNLLPLA